MRYEAGAGGAWINPDSKLALRVVVIVTAMLALVSFAVSFAGLVAVAEWAAIPGWLAWALPAFVDGAIIVYTIAMLVFRSRGHSTVFAWTALLTFTAVSVAANAAHAYAEGNAGSWQTWVGAGLAGLAPAGVAVAIHTIAMLTVRPSETAATHVAPATEKGEQPSHYERQVPMRPAHAERSPGENAKELDGDLVARALTLREQGLSQKAIGDELGRGKTTIGRWLREHDHHARAVRAVQ